jgi:hypothetical protein
MMDDDWYFNWFNLFSFCLVFFGLYEPGGVLGGGGLKCVKPGFGGGFGGYRGFWGVNPGFTHFGSLGSVLGVWFV